MKSKKVGKYTYNYCSTFERKYLERVEKDGSVIYSKFIERIRHTGNEHLPVDNRQDFIQLWYHMPATDR